MTEEESNGSSWRQVGCLLFGLIGGLVIGSGCAVEDLGTVPGRELTSAERSSAHLLYETVPGSLRLDILPPAEIARRHPGARGYARYGGGVCAITIPSGMTISVYPRDGMAFFHDPFDAEVIAHELTHCFLGDWHAR